MTREKDHWDQQFRSGSYSADPTPPAALTRFVDAFPDGRALDLATGTGRISVFLATKGYAVDAVDQSRAGLEIARGRAADRGVTANWIQADLSTFVVPPETYDLVTVRSCRVVDRLSDLKAALCPGGVLFYQDHLRTDEPMDSGPSDDRLRLAPNELLRACLDLTVLHYAEFRTVKSTGKTGTYAQVIAQRDPAAPLPDDG